MKILYISALLLAIAATQVYSQTCHLREIDLCMATGMFHYQSNGIPPTEEKVDEWCEAMHEVGECMSNFTAKCLSPVQREVIGLLSGSEESARSICVKGSEVRARYLQNAECLSEGTESDEFKNIMKDLQVVIEKLFEVKYKERFPLTCCGLRRFHKSIDDMTERRCGKEAVDMTQSMIKMVVSELPSTLCQSFDPASAQCIELLPAPGTPSKGGENKSQLGKLLDTVFGGN